ncbi:hypothetical protein FOZ63_001567 [Perkinsus olseni]|uniref:Uncharacterized protein n=1 Tax=Perkinsus olseni TaxID=32597 RepID=A0A7J6T2G3_PEROL|nr:hypothetical protein FOZ63_001567 [Perkinsus olseni]
MLKWRFFQHKPTARSKLSGLYGTRASQTHRKAEGRASQVGQVGVVAPPLSHSVRHDKRPRIVAPAGRPRHVHEHITLPAYLAVEKLPALIVANTAHQQPSRKACPLHYHYHVATQLPFLNRSHGLH